MIKLVGNSLVLEDNMVLQWKLKMEDFEFFSTQLSREFWEVFM